MSWLGTVRSVGSALGVWSSRIEPAGATLGRLIYKETRRAAFLVNAHRRPRPLHPATVDRLQSLFGDVHLRDVRIRERCRLPANRFKDSGSIYAMTFGSTILFRDELDEEQPRDLVRLIHELVHVAQVRRLGGEDAFARAYGEGYVRGGGELPDHLRNVGAYHRNPLEAEAYRFEARFRDAAGRVVAGSLPIATSVRDDR